MGANERAERKSLREVLDLEPQFSKTGAEDMYAAVEAWVLDALVWAQAAAVSTHINQGIVLQGDAYKTARAIIEGREV